MSIKANKLSCRQFTQEELDGFREAFNLYDVDKSGFLDLNEITNLMNQCNIGPEFAKLLMRIVDENNDGKVSFGEFVFFLNLLSKLDEDPDIISKMLFKILDIDRSGYLEKNEIQLFLNYYSKEPVSDKEVNEYITKYDTNGDRKLSLQEVLKILG